MIDIIGDMMCSILLAPMGVHVLTSMERPIRIDKDATLDDLFSKQMPMSSLKVLIKFYFRTQAIDIGRIKHLFDKSSADGRVCILEHFYLRALEDEEHRPIFFDLLVNVSGRYVDIFVSFFRKVATYDDNRDFESETLKVLKPVIESEKIRPELLDFAGHLQDAYNVSYETCLNMIKQVAYQQVELNYILIYTCKNYPEKSAELGAYLNRFFFTHKGTMTDDCCLYNALISLF